jgi:hypothetical protein
VIVSRQRSTSAPPGGQRKREPSSSNWSLLDTATSPWPRRSIVEILDGDAGRAVKPIGRLVDKLSHTDVSRLKQRFGDGDEPAASGRG